MANEPIECPRCEHDIREATQQETNALHHWIAEEWSLTSDDYPTIILCPDCGWFEVIDSHETWGRWYDTVKKILDVLE